MRAILLTLAILAPAIASAEDARPVQCRFLGFGTGEESSSVISLTEKGAEINCPLSSSALSPQVVCFAKENTIGFFSSGDHKPAATATIPAQANSAILIFVPTPKGADASPSKPLWRVLVIEDSSKNFPDGGAFIANFYNKDIRFVVGEHKGMLHAAGSHGYPKPKEVDSFNMAPVIFEFLQNDKWRIANESSLRFLPGMRYLIFAYVDPVSGRPRIQTYQDFAAPIAAKTKP